MQHTSLQRTIRSTCSNYLVCHVQVMSYAIEGQSAFMQSLNRMHGFHCNRVLIKTIVVVINVVCTHALIEEGYCSKTRASMLQVNMIMARQLRR